MTIGLLSEERRKLNREKQNIISDTSLRNSPKHSLALIDMPFMNLVIQDGPYCPKSCAHCHGNFGPNKPKADMRLYEEVMKQLPDTDIAHIIITDGEPFHNINRLEDILTVLDGMPVELNTSGEFAKTVEDAEKIFDRLSSAGLNFKKQERRSIVGTTNSTISVSADKYHGEKSFSYALNILKAFHNVFKDISVKDITGKYQDTKHHIAISGLYNKENFFTKIFNEDRLSYFIQRRALAELDKKIIVPLKKFIPHNNYGHLKSGVGHFVTDNMAVYIVPMSLVFYGRAENLSRKALKRENVFHPKKASSPFPESPNLYLMSSGDVYDVPSFHCAVPGRLKGNIFQENLKQIIDRTMQQTVFRVERERGIRGIYHHLYANGVRIKANDHCELCRSIFADKKSIDTYNMLLSEPWKKYEHKLIERFNANNSLPSLDIRSQGI